MKLYKLNSFTTFLFSFLILGLVVLFPIMLIEVLWNSTIGKTYTDMAIDFWQALILWLVVLTGLNILGIFRFEFAVETGESLDKELIKKKLEGIKNLQKKTNEKAEIDKESTKETKD